MKFFGFSLVIVGLVFAHEGQPYPSKSIVLRPPDSKSARNYFVALANMLNEIYEKAKGNGKPSKGGGGKVCQLDYPNGSQDDYVEAFPNFSQDFDELSLSFWLKVPSSYTNNLAIVSYRTQDESRDMSVAIKDNSEVEFKINGGGKTLKSNFVRDNTWQNIAITLKDDGKVKMYRNGQKISEDTGMKQGNIKKDAQGKLQLGKKYDGADPTFVIQGSLAELYMWDIDLSDEAVKKIFGFKCGSMGNWKSNELILSWDTILNSNGLKGQVKKTCPTTCSG